MQDLAGKMVCPFALRIEQVLLFAGGVVPPRIAAQDAFVHNKVKELFITHPVLPYKLGPDGQGFLCIIHEVIEFLVGSLSNLYRKHAGLGGYEASWRAFQYELALEELFYGHPLSTTDGQLSTSLGTSSVNPNSVTHRRGFIGLAPHNSAGAGEVPPPLLHWTRDELQVTRIERVFLLTDVLGPQPSVVGLVLVQVLLGDLFQRNDRIPLTQMQESSPSHTLKGAVTMEVFVEDLATKDAFPVPNTFKRARQLVAGAGHDVSQCLLARFQELKLQYFPAIKFRDIRNTKRVTWNFNDYVELHVSSEEPSAQAKGAAMVGDICIEIERHSLTYARNLECYKEHGMAWGKPLLSKY